MKGAAIFLLVAGCFSKPDAPASLIDAQPIDAACVPSQSAPGLLATTAAAPTVTWPGGMQLRFGDPTQNVAMPDFFSLTGMNLIAEPQPAQCTAEDRVGAAVYPAFSASPTSVAAAFAPTTLDRIIVGPAYSEYTVHWSHSFTCGTATSVATGNSIFSLFPDGRIVRNDTITPATVPMSVVLSCDCTSGPAPGFRVTTYFALRRDRLGLFALPGSPEGGVPVTGPDQSDQVGGCVGEMGPAPGRLAVVFDGLPSRGRLRSVGPLGPMGQIVFVHDLHNAATLPANATYGGRTIMAMSPANGRDCAQLFAAARAVWPSISIGPVGGAPAAIISSLQQVYVDTTVYAGPITVSAPSAVPPGLVISVRLPGTSIVTSRTDGVVWQREADGRFIVWFRDGMAAGSSVTITPECV